jgi:hypothetical protein
MKRICIVPGIQGVLNMLKPVAINYIEQEIEALPPVDQIMMLERIVKHLKQLLLAHPIVIAPRTESKVMTEKLNVVYKSETSQLDPQLFNAQLVSLGKNEW